MKWNIVVLLWLFGVAMGVASLYGLTENVELYEWSIIALIITYILPKQTRHKIFLHGFYSGVGMGVLFTMIQASFFDMYLQNNRSAAAIQRIFGETDPRIFIVFSGPVIGAAYGLILGFFTQLSARFHIPE